MNKRILELAKEAGFQYEDYKDIWFLEGLNPSCNEELKKFSELIIKETRVKAIEELRQELKWADWPISSWAIVEDACEKLSQKEPDNRYTK